MTLSAPILSSLTAIGIIFATMVAIAAVEVAIPLHARGRWNRAHLAPNLTLTLLNFGINLFLNAALVAMVVWLERVGFGLLHWLSLPSLAAAIVAIAALDFSFYVAHVSWHKSPRLWRVHAIHHSDPAVDVTTSVRQHPLQGLLLSAALGAMAIAIGPSPAAFAVYRSTSMVNALLEHSNIRSPYWLDRLLSLVTTWPHMHKVHHSRVAEQTDSNYGNLFSIWDRIFGTFTPSHLGTKVAYGLEGFDDPALQTTTALLAHPFAATQRLGETDELSSPATWRT